MNALTPAKERAEDASLQQLPRQTVEAWSDVCQRFLDRQRHEILEREPSPEKLREHRAALKLRLRLAHAMYFTVCDPDYPDRHLADELQGRLLQLEHSWRITQQPMANAEADEMLRKVFPG